MVEVTYHCPYCGAVTSLERDAYLADGSVTAEPLDGRTYAATTDDFDDADGVELVCLGDAGPDARGTEAVAADTGENDPVAADGPDAAADGCGRTFYLNFVSYEDGERVDPEGGWLEDEPNFDFLR